MILPVLREVRRDEAEWPRYRYRARVDWGDDLTVWRYDRWSWLAAVKALLAVGPCRWWDRDWFW